MKKTIRRLILPGLLVLVAIFFIRCSSSPDWKKTNKDLIKEYALTERKIPGLPKTKISSNLEPGKVSSLDNIAATELSPGVSARIYWGSGTMTALLELEPGAEINEETLASDRLVFVLEGTIDQLIDGSFINMISRKREEPDGTHSLTPRIDFVYLEKGSKNAVKAGPSGAKLLEVYSPVRIDYLEKTVLPIFLRRLWILKTYLSRILHRIRFMICMICNLLSWSKVQMQGL
jgi:gluconolactonase